MGQLRATGFVGADSLRLVAQPSLLLMIGDIGCLGNISISVEKYLAIATPKATPSDVLDGAHDVNVHAILYAYHAAVRGHGMILRYDNNHPWRGHADEHHVHRGDWRNSGDDSGRVDWVGADRWPTLGDVIREITDWYYVHRDELPAADAYADPLQREPHILWNPFA
jgi:hypothetical protein